MKKHWNCLRGILMAAFILGQTACSGCDWDSGTDSSSTATQSGSTITTGSSGGDSTSSSNSDSTDSITTASSNTSAAEETPATGSSVTTITTTDTTSTTTTATTPITEDSTPAATTGTTSTTTQTATAAPADTTSTSGTDTTPPSDTTPATDTTPPADTTPAPTATPVAIDGTTNVNEDEPVTITLSATDSDSTTLTYAIASSTSHGSLSDPGSGNTITYTPVSDYNGTDSFTFTASDGVNSSSAATVTITVAAVNDAPVISSPPSATLDEDSSASVTLSASDADGDVLIYTILTNPEHGTVSIPDSSGMTTYTPVENYNGSDSFTFIATDPSGVVSNTVTATLTITAVNDAPTISDLSTNVGLDSLGRVYPNPVTAVNSTLTGTDIDGDALTYSIVTAPTAGAASITGNVLTYTPTTPFTAGRDQITYQANDGNATSNTGTITITSDAISTAALESTSFSDHGVALTYAAGTYAEYKGVQGATVAYDAKNKIYYMYFESWYAAASSSCSKGYWGIGVATSNDGSTWTQSSSLVITPTAGTSYACQAAQPAVVYDGSKFHLFFALHTSPDVQDGIAYATSTDGTTFTTPVKITSGVKSFPSAIMVNSKLYVYYYIQNGTKYYVDREWSNDGGQTWAATTNINSNMISTLSTWASGTLFQNTTKIVTHSVFYDSSDTILPYKMYIIGNNTSGSTTSSTNPYYVGGLLESADGVTWTLSATLPVVANPTWYWHHEILLYGHNYLMWYKTLGSNSKAQINFSSTLSVWP